MAEIESKSTVHKLTQPVQFLRGVGPHRAELLEKLGLRTAADVLFFFPRKYQDFTQLASIDQLVNDELTSVVGTIDDIDHSMSGNGRHVLYVLLRQENQYLRRLVQSTVPRAKIPDWPESHVSGQGPDSGWAISNDASPHHLDRPQQFGRG